MRVGDLVTYDGSPKRVSAISEENGECCLVDPKSGGGGTWVSPKNVAPAPASEDDGAPEDAIGRLVETRIAAVTDEKSTLEAALAKQAAEIDRLKAENAALGEDRDRLKSRVAELEAQNAALEAVTNKENPNAEGQQGQGAESGGEGEAGGAGSQGT